MFSLPPSSLLKEQPQNSKTFESTNVKQCRIKCRYDLIGVPDKTELGFSQFRKAPKAGYTAIFIDSILKCSKGEKNSRTEEKVRVPDIMSFFCCWLYSHWWTSASSKTVRHSSLTRGLRLQFLTLMFFTSSSTDPSHINLRFPTRCLPSDLSTVSFLQGSSSCILNRCPSHIILPIFTTFTTPSSS